MQLLSHDKDVAVPLCLGHDLPFQPLIYDVQAQGPDHYRPRQLKPGESGLVQVDCSGGGGMLIRRHVLETIKDPWFEVHIQHHESPPRQTTEDFDFCQKVREAGFQIWCDLDCIVGHTTIFHVWPLRQPDGTWSASIVRRDNEIQVAL